jgi:hypothetical protein
MSLCAAHVCDQRLNEMTDRELRQVLVRGVVLKHRQTIEEIEPDVPERISDQIDFSDQFIDVSLDWL